MKLILIHNAAPPVVTTDDAAETAVVAATTDDTDAAPVSIANGSLSIHAIPFSLLVTSDGGSPSKSSAVKQFSPTD